MQFVNLDNIKELKTIFTLYILIALKEKYMETYHKICRDEINERYLKNIDFADWVAGLPWGRAYTFSKKNITHIGLAPDKTYYSWEYNVAKLPKRYKYSSGMNCPDGFKNVE